jgi:hypothetical protein
MTVERGSSDSDSAFPAASSGNLLGRIRKGMRVVDANGEEIGKVEIVKMGDPAAATVGADAERDAGLVQNFAEAFGFEPEPDVPAQLRRHMMRVGFIKIDSKGLFAKDRYVTADRIDVVASDTVGLNVRKDQLLERD